MSVQTIMQAAFNKTIETLGLPATWTAAQGGATQALPQVGFASLGRNDETLVNSYGVAAKVITIRADQMGTNQPHKFDSITIGTEKHVLAAVHPIHAGVVVIGWKCVSKGSSS